MKASYALRGSSRRTAPAAASDPATFMFGQPPDSQSLNAERHACGCSPWCSSVGGSDSACSLSRYLTTYFPLPRAPTQKQAAPGLRPDEFANGVSVKPHALAPES